MSLLFSLVKMFVRKSNNMVHVIFKDTIENIKVSTFAADGKRQFVLRVHYFYIKKLEVSLQFYI